MTDKAKTTSRLEELKGLKAALKGKEEILKHVTDNDASCDDIDCTDSDCNSHACLMLRIDQAIKREQ